MIRESRKQGTLLLSDIDVNHLCIYTDSITPQPSHITIIIGIYAVYDTLLSDVMKKVWKFRFLKTITFLMNTESVDDFDTYIQKYRLNYSGIEFNRISELSVQYGAGVEERKVIFFFFLDNKLNKYIKSKSTF